MNRTMTQPTLARVALTLTATLLILACQSAAQGRTMTIPLREMNATGVSGTAILTELGNGKTRVALNVNAAGNTDMPSHIHPGTCSDLVPQPRYPLQNVKNGTAATELAVTIDELLRQPTVVMTHKSNEQMNVYSSCGEIR